MAHGWLKDSTLAHSLSVAVADLAAFFQKELRLAKTEISSKISTKINAGIWTFAAAPLASMAAIFVLQAIILAIASYYDIAMHWSCLIVAAGLAVLAAIAFLKGRADAQEDLTPGRTVHQIKRDISTAKEQLT